MCVAVCCVVYTCVGECSLVFSSMCWRALFSEGSCNYWCVLQVLVVEFVGFFMSVYVNMCRRVAVTCCMLLLFGVCRCVSLPI